MYWVLIIEPSSTGGGHEDQQAEKYEQGTQQRRHRLGAPGRPDGPCDGSEGRPAPSWPGAGQGRKAPYRRAESRPAGGGSARARRASHRVAGARHPRRL